MGGFIEGAVNLESSENGGIRKIKVQGGRKIGNQGKALRWSGARGRLFKWGPDISVGGGTDEKPGKGKENRDHMVRVTSMSAGLALDPLDISKKIPA